jgi:hypothetical protein
MTTDREMLLMCYGAMKALEQSEQSLGPIVEELEDYIWPVPEEKDAST